MTPPSHRASAATSKMAAPLILGDMSMQMINATTGCVQLEMDLKWSIQLHLCCDYILSIVVVISCDMQLEEQS